jgi:hypothetical protein
VSFVGGGVPLYLHRPAVGEPMTHRMRMEAPGILRASRSLHVLQGADGTAVVFPDDLRPDADTTTLAVRAGVTRQLVTGLAPDTDCQVIRHGDRVTVSTGGPTRTDHGGVLLVNG